MSEVTGTALCTAVMRKLRITDPSETPGTVELANIFEEFKRMVRSWGSLGNLIYVSSVDSVSLTAGTKYYSIGSGGNIDTVRPIRILNSSYVTANGRDYPLKVVNESRYLGIAEKDFSPLSYANLIYYRPTYPLGYIYLWPPSGGDLMLMSMKQLDEPATIGASIEIPDEYQDAIVWNLACRMATEFIGEPSVYLVSMAQKAMSDLISMNESNDMPELSNELTLLGMGKCSYDIDSE